MDYIGSKSKLNEWIFSEVKKFYPNPSGVRFFDACSGSGSVSRYAASNGYNVIACDSLMFASHLINGSIGVEHLLKEAAYHVEVMNDLQGVQGFFYKNYSEHVGRFYFTGENASKIDAARQYVDTLPDSKLKSVLIYFLIEGLSRVINTSGTHGAFLKGWKMRALEPFKVRVEKTVAGNAVAYCGDMINFIDTPCDILYIDPPYNQRQYAPNYHLYETLARYDNPVIKGKTGLREWAEVKSGFCNRKSFVDLLKIIIEKANTPLILLSYSSDGLVSSQEIIDSASRVETVCSVHQYARDQRRYKADNRREYNQKPLREFLFFFLKNGA